MHPHTPPTLLDDDFLVQELRVARRHLTESLDNVREFVVFSTEHPWVHLEDLLSDIRAAAITVAVLEGQQARHP